MDELDISGKRYISTRRAAKEYKYHSDYIGQLIRGKKLLGRKVGRSWYVELESVAQYFGKEGVVVPVSELVAKEVKKEEVVAAPVEVVEQPVVKQQPVVVAAVVEVAKEPEQKVEIRIEKPEFISEPIAETFKEKNIEIEDGARDSIHIPVRIRRPSFEVTPTKKASTLTYVSDSEPYIPMTRRVESEELPASVVMPRTQEEAEEMFDESEVVEEKKASRLSRVTPIFGVVVLGLVVLVVVVGSSILVSSHTVIEAGQPASVGYSL